MQLTQPAEKEEVCMYGQSEKQFHISLTGIPT